MVFVLAALTSRGVRDGPIEQQERGVGSVDRRRALASERPLGGGAGAWRPLRGCDMQGVRVERRCDVCFSGGDVAGGARWTDRAGVSGAAISAKNELGSEFETH